MKARLISLFLASMALAAAANPIEEGCIDELKKIVHSYEIPSDLSEFLKLIKMDWDTMNLIHDEDTSRQMNAASQPVEGCKDMLSLYPELPCSGILDPGNREQLPALMKADPKLETFWRGMVSCIVFKLREVGL